MPKFINKAIMNKVENFIADGKGKVDFGLDPKLLQMHTNNIINATINDEPIQDEKLQTSVAYFVYGWYLQTDFSVLEGPRNIQQYFSVSMKLGFSAKEFEQLCVQLNTYCKNNDIPAPNNDFGVEEVKEISEEPQVKEEPKPFVLPKDWKEEIRKTAIDEAVNSPYTVMDGFHYYFHDNLMAAKDSEKFFEDAASKNFLYHFVLNDYFEKKTGGLIDTERYPSEKVYKHLGISEESIKEVFENLDKLPIDFPQNDKEQELESNKTISQNQQISPNNENDEIELNFDINSNNEISNQPQNHTEVSKEVAPNVVEEIKQPTSLLNDEIKNTVYRFFENHGQEKNSGINPDVLKSKMKLLLNTKKEGQEILLDKDLKNAVSVCLYANFAMSRTDNPLSIDNELILDVLNAEKKLEIPNQELDLFNKGLKQSEKFLYPKDAQTKATLPDEMKQGIIQNALLNDYDLQSLKENVNKILQSDVKTPEELFNNKELKEVAIAFVGAERTIYDENYNEGYSFNHSQKIGRFERAQVYQKLGLNEKDVNALYTEINKEYIERIHAEKIPTEEQNKKNLSYNVRDVQNSIGEDFDVNDYVASVMNDRKEDEKQKNQLYAKDPNALKDSINYLNKVERDHLIGAYPIIKNRHEQRKFSEIKGLGNKISALITHVKEHFTINKMTSRLKELHVDENQLQGLYQHACELFTFQNGNATLKEQPKAEKAEVVNKPLFDGKEINTNFNPELQIDSINKNFETTNKTQEKVVEQPNKS